MWASECLLPSSLPGGVKVFLVTHFLHCLSEVVFWRIVQKGGDWRCAKSPVAYLNVSPGRDITCWHSIQEFPYAKGGHRVA